MQVMVPTEACDLTIAQILSLESLSPALRIRALRERQTELKRREATMQQHTTEGEGSPLTALRAELREAQMALGGTRMLLLDFFAWYCDRGHDVGDQYETIDTYMRDWMRSPVDVGTECD